jgi:putative ABC transport system ATP-binding protein
MRAILTGPDVLLLDEPTSALDAESAGMVFSIIERLNTEEGKTLIIVTHSDYSPAVPRVRKCIFRNGNLECA